MWKALQSLAIGENSHSKPEEQGDEEHLAKQCDMFEPQAHAGLETSEPGTCHFLRLPVEIRLQIYSYTDIAGRTIEVLHLPILQSIFGAQCYRTYRNSSVNHELLYRIELEKDREYEKRGHSTPTPRRRWLPLGQTVPLEPSSSLTPAKRKRCFSVRGLFSLTSVCKQTRTDVQVLIYELNSFAFSDVHYNCSRAIRAFIRTLPERELFGVRTIYWPLVNFLAYRHSLRGENVEEPDAACAEELRGFQGLRRLVLRYGDAEFNSFADKHNEEEKMELQRLLAANNGQHYTLIREFRRTLALRASKVVIRDHVNFECEKSWRAAF